jgi:hypothetical protein
MATNSKRETMLNTVKDNLGQLPCIHTVQRVRPQFADLEGIPSTQMPMIAVVGRLPKPVEKRSARVQGDVDKFVSMLGVELYCYALANVDPDSVISDLADEIWRKLWESPTLEFEWVLELSVTPEVQVGIWDPYVVFKIDCQYKYVHDTGGI